jgi:hypothetical protein
MSGSREETTVRTVCGVCETERNTYLSLEIAAQLPLLLTSPSGDEIQINLTRNGIRLKSIVSQLELKRMTAMDTYCTLPDSISDQSERFFDILQVDSFRESHPGVSFRQSDHTFELSGGGCDSSFLCSHILSDLPHFDV